MTKSAFDPIVVIVGASTVSVGAIVLPRERGPRVRPRRACSGLKPRWGEACEQYELVHDPDSKVSLTQDRHLGHRLTDRQTAEVLDSMLGEEIDRNGRR
jgi:hypothetical protein